jgi:Carboxypeptidase regulatory-like domain
MATITLRNNGTGQALTAVTDPEGLYRFSLLPPGQYEMTVQMAGFEPSSCAR